MQCFRHRFGCSAYVEKDASRFCKQGTDTNSTNRKWVFSCSLPIHIWSKSHCPKWSQTIGNHSPKTPFACAQKIAGHDAELTTWTLCMCQYFKNTQSLQVLCNWHQYSQSYNKTFCQSLRNSQTLHWVRLLLFSCFISDLQVPLLHRKGHAYTKQQREFASHYTMVQKQMRTYEILNIFLFYIPSHKLQQHSSRFLIVKYICFQKCYFLS